MARGANKDGFFKLLKSIQDNWTDGYVIVVWQSSDGGWYITSKSTNDWYYLSDFKEYSCKIRSNTFGSAHYIRKASYKKIGTKYMKHIIDQSNNQNSFANKYGIAIPEESNDLFDKIVSKVRNFISSLKEKKR